MTRAMVFKRNDAWWKKIALGLRGQAETSLKIEDVRSNKTTGKLSYMHYFLCSRMSRIHILYTKQ
jgi:hypothetical protein